MSIDLVTSVLAAVYFLCLYFTIFWLLVLFEKETPRKVSELRFFPDFSVIVPAYNEENSIIGTLQSIIDLDYPKENLELVVVNDGSTDSTYELVKKFVEENDFFDIKLISYEKNKGKGKAMNKGLEIIRGKFFACLDADSFVEKNALKKMLSCFYENHDVAAVCPLLKIKNPKNLIQRIQWYEYIINMFYKKLNAKLDCIHVTPGPFSIYKTKIVRDLGGYDEDNMTEDLELAIRLQKHHYKIVQTMDAVVYTLGPNNIKALFKQRNRWYKGSIYNTLRYRKLIFNKNYGDFGVIRMPTILISGLLSIVILLVLSYDFFDWLYRFALHLYSINFDIIFLIKKATLSFNLLDINFINLLVASVLFILGFLVMIYSHKYTGEKITRHGKTFISLFSYMFLYSFFLTIVWTVIAYEIVLGKKQKW